LKRYAIGPLHLDVEQRVLYSGRDVVGLSPKSFDILLVLVENAGQVISRDAIREQVWGDAFIEDANLSNNISMLRAALREHLGDVQAIKTFSKRGYQFTLPVGLVQAGVAADGVDEDSGEDRPPEQAVPAAGPVVLPETARSPVWKTRGNLVLGTLFLAGLAVALMLIRFARLGTLAERPAATALLAGLEHVSLGLHGMQPVPELLATLALAGVLAVVAMFGRRRPDLHLGSWVLALLCLVGMQVVGTVSDESTVRHTIGLLGQVLLFLTLAAYKREKAPLSRWWVFYADVLPLLIFVVCCGLDVKKASIYVVLSAVGRLMLVGTYVLRRNAPWPILVAVAGWVSMALLAASGRYLGAAFTAIAILALYAAVNLTLRLPEGNPGKPMVVAGALVWALYAATYPGAFAHGALHPFWSLLLDGGKALIGLGMAVFVVRAGRSAARG
jgi:DNA-binding winged helix-turn-helix (wHTH) protein